MAKPSKLEPALPPAQRKELDAALKVAKKFVAWTNDDREEALRALPAEASDALRYVYAVLAGTSIEPEDGHAIDIFDPAEMEDVRGQTGYHAAVPGAVFFASDGGSGWFFEDTTGKLGGTKSAVMWGDRSGMRTGLRRVAPDIGAFLRAAAAGETHPNTKQPTLEET